MVKISACVITKNEEKNIGRWLGCVKQLASEIVVVDTGSTDATVSIAERGGARIEHFPWIDDFAAAKNYALDQCHGDWIIFLDADEYFTPSSLPQIRASVRELDKRKRVIGIACRLLDIDRDQHNKLKDSMVQIRIFRKLGDLRFVGKIHEHLQDFANSGREMHFVEGIEIYHTGYSAGIINDKHRRNKAILEREYEKADEKGRQLISSYLMDCYYGLGDYEGAIRQAQIAIDSGFVFVGRETSPYVVMALALFCLKKPEEEIRQALKQGEEKYPHSAEFLLLEAFSYWGENDYLAAEDCLKRAEALQATKKCRSDEAFADDSLQFWPDAYCLLGELAAKRFEKAAALEYYLKGLKTYLYHDRLLTAFLRECGDFPATEVIEIINSLYDKEQDAAFLLSVLVKLKGLEKVYLYYAPFCSERDRADDFTAAGRYDAAAAEVSDRTGRLYHLGIWSAATLKLPPQCELSTLLPLEYRQKWYSRAGLPLVSIMIPTYNRPELFEETLKSALSQTYGNFEVIVCDNSTDERTAELIGKYLGDERLHYCRNRLAKTKEENFLPFEYLAKGEYLQWCMDDDLLLPDKLEKMMAVFGQYPSATLVTSQRRVIDHSGDTMAEHWADLRITGELIRYTGEELGKALLSTGSNFIGEPSAVLFRRRDLKNHYWRADCRGYKVISDVAMWLELLEKGDGVIFREALSCYRRHEDQEGFQPDVILLSRLEWAALCREYYERGIFIGSEAEYKAALGNWWQEYRQGRFPQDYGSREMYERYAECMEGIGKLLGE